MYEGETFCEVYQCFSRDHERENHQCVRCKEKGHGHRECPKKNYGLLLKTHFIPKDLVEKLKAKKETGTDYDEMGIHSIFSGEWSTGSLKDGRTFFVKNMAGILQCIIVTAEQNEYLHKKNLRFENVHFFRHFVNRYHRS